MKRSFKINNIRLLFLFVIAGIFSFSSCKVSVVNKVEELKYAKRKYGEHSFDIPYPAGWNEVKDKECIFFAKPSPNPKMELFFFNKFSSQETGYGMTAILQEIYESLIQSQSDSFVFVTQIITQLEYGSVKAYYSVVSTIQNGNKYVFLAFLSRKDDEIFNFTYKSLLDEALSEKEPLFWEIVYNLKQDGSLIFDPKKMKVLSTKTFPKERE